MISPVLAVAVAVAVVVALAMSRLHIRCHCLDPGYPPRNQFLAAEASHFDGKPAKLLKGGKKLEKKRSSVQEYKSKYIIINPKCQIKELNE